MTLLDDQTPLVPDRSLERPVTRSWAEPRPAYVVAVALLMLAAAVLGLLAHQGTQVDAARHDALAQAQKRLPVLLTYRHDHLGPDLARAVDQTTGSFRSAYADLVARTVRPTAEQRKVDTTAAVSGAGVIRAIGDRVVVLAFLTQSSVTPGGAPVVSGSRVEVTMVRVGDAWLIGDLEPV